MLKGMKLFCAQMSVHDYKCVLVGLHTECLLCMLSDREWYPCAMDRRTNLFSTTERYTHDLALSIVLL